MQNRPTYAIESVDRALRLASLLQQEGAMRVTDAAAALGISVSGAHRLLSTLVYRDFAEQLPDRSYGPGHVLQVAEPADAPIALLRRIGPAHLRALVDRVEESANLMVRVGAETRFVSTIETDRVLRVGDRAGRRLPAHRSSGGKALLAALSLPELTAVYEGSGIDARKLHRSLHRARLDGYAVNRGETEVGVSAIGMAVRGADGRPTCAISVGLPSTRFSRTAIPALVAALSEAREAIEADLRQRTGDDDTGC